METSEIRRVLDLGGLEFPENQKLTINGNGPIFTNRYRVDEIAAVVLAVTGGAAAQLWNMKGGFEQEVAVDVRTAAAATASYTFDRINGEKHPPGNSAVSDFYECRDGDWIHLHGGLPHLHEGTLALLKCGLDRESIATAVKRWDSFELEEELAARNMCAARARSADEWQTHPQGAIVTSTSALELIKLADGEPVALPPGPRPLSSVRVLEFARILAGPVSGRTLAEHGADVLNVSAEYLPGLFSSEINTGSGKRSCFLDMKKSDEMSRVLELAMSSDIIVNGYRSGSLEQRGLGPYELALARPGIIYVSINCYGHEGPWATRRGWEQLAQSASGLAIGQGRGGRPLRMPALYPGDDRQATAPNDYLTGYLAAYGAMSALAIRATQGGSWWVRVSLCQTASWLEHCGMINMPEEASGLGDPSDLIQTRTSQFGELTQMVPAVRMSVTPPRWDLPPSPRGSDKPEWQLV